MASPRPNVRRGRIRLLMGAVAALVVVGAVVVVLSVTSPGGAPRAAIESAAVTPTPTRAAVLPVPSSTPGPSTAGIPEPTPQSSPRAPGSASAPVLSISGGGNHAKTKLQIAGGTYLVDYVVSSPSGGSCPWAIFLTDSDGLDLLMASAYPVNETVRGEERDSGIAAGSAAVRVESECPDWSASMTRIGP